MLIINQGYKPQGKPWTQISSCAVAVALAQATRDGVLYPPLSAGLIDLQISMHFVFEI
jgi:hypothetical protein